MHVVRTHRFPKHNLQHGNYLKGCFFLMPQVLGFLDIIKSYVFLSSFFLKQIIFLAVVPCMSFLAIFVANEWQLGPS